MTSLNCCHIGFCSSLISGGAVALGTRRPTGISGLPNDPIWVYLSEYSLNSWYPYRYGIS